jgi:hypothetical protein
MRTEAPACNSGRLEVRLRARTRAKRDLIGMSSWRFRVCVCRTGVLVARSARAGPKWWGIAYRLVYRRQTHRRTPFSLRAAVQTTPKRCSVQRRSGGASGPLVDDRPSYSGAAQVFVACLSLLSAGARFACCAINSLEAIPVRPATPFPYLGPLASGVRVGRRVYLIHIPPLSPALVRFCYVCLLNPAVHCIILSLSLRDCLGVICEQISRTASYYNKRRVGTLETAVPRHWAILKLLGMIV